MVCSCVIPSKSAFAANNILLMRNSNHARSCGRSCVKWQIAIALPRVYRFHPKIENKLGDQMIKQLLNSVIAKYRDLSVSRRSIICLSLRLRQIIDLLATDKSRYFAQPRPIIVNYPRRLGLHKKEPGNEFVLSPVH